ncbi:hypothetical protein B0J17DRAFT_659575, partial [Rhizoctonia solani]
DVLAHNTTTGIRGVEPSDTASLTVYELTRRRGIPTIMDPPTRDLGECHPWNQSKIFSRWYSPPEAHTSHPQDKVLRGWSLLTPALDLLSCTDPLSSSVSGTRYSVLNKRWRIAKGGWPISIPSGGHHMPRLSSPSLVPFNYPNKSR